MSSGLNRNSSDFSSVTADVQSELPGAELAALISETLSLLPNANGVRAEAFIRFRKGSTPLVLVHLVAGGTEFLLTDKSAEDAASGLRKPAHRVSVCELQVRLEIADKIDRAMREGRDVIAFTQRGVH